MKKKIILGTLFAATALTASYFTYCCMEGRRSRVVGKKQKDFDKCDEDELEILDLDILNEDDEEPSTIGDVSEL